MLLINEHNNIQWHPKEVLYIPMIAVRKKTHSFCYSSPRILYKNSNYYLSSMYVEWQYGQVYMLIEKCWVWLLSTTKVTEY
jgi:hypothetical protein